jgi:hypothetical protein
MHPVFARGLPQEVIRVFHRFTRRAFVAGAAATTVTTLLPVHSLARQDAPPDPIAILQAASVRLADTPTVRFKLKIDGKTYIDDANAIQLLEAEGDLVRPDRVFASFKIKVLGAVTANINLITVGDRYWSTDLISGRWVEAPPEFTYDPKTLFDDENGIGPVMDKVKDPVLIGEEELDDRKTWHIQALVPQEIIGDLTSNTMDGEPITVDLWIEKDTSDLLRAQLAEPKDGDKEDPATWTLDLHDHGAEFTIEPPK